MCVCVCVCVCLFFKFEITRVDCIYYINIQRFVDYVINYALHDQIMSLQEFIQKGLPLFPEHLVKAIAGCLAEPIDSSQMPLQKQMIHSKTKQLDLFSMMIIFSIFQNLQVYGYCKIVINDTSF